MIQKQLEKWCWIVNPVSNISVIRISMSWSGSRWHLSWHKLLSKSSENSLDFEITDLAWASIWGNKSLLGLEEELQFLASKVSNWSLLEMERWCICIGTNNNIKTNSWGSSWGDRARGQRGLHSQPWQWWWWRFKMNSENAWHKVGVQFTSWTASLGSHKML